MLRAAVDFPRGTTRHYHCYGWPVPAAASSLDLVHLVGHDSSRGFVGRLQHSSSWWSEVATTCHNLLLLTHLAADTEKPLKRQACKDTSIRLSPDYDQASYTVSIRSEPTSLGIFWWPSGHNHLSVVPELDGGLGIAAQQHMGLSMQSNIHVE